MDPIIITLIAIIVPTLGVSSFFLLRKKKKTAPPATLKRVENSVQVTTPPQAPQQKIVAHLPTSPWWNALSKTRAKFFFNKQFKGEISQLKESLEEACLISDLGVTNTNELIEKMDWNKISEVPADQRLGFAKQEISSNIKPWLKASSSHENPSDLSWLLRHKDSQTPETAGPIVIWFVGVNGVGKTTSISKLATELKNKGHSVLLGAGDTFRAAASEQLETWAERIGIPIVKGQPGSDSSAVLFDAIQSAKSKGIEFVLCDSAGRLHNQTQLMDSLKKVSRILDKAQKGAPHEVLLVLDANTGQNMINQADHFLSAVGVTGLILTKLDGTAKGGAVVAVARKTNLPIRRLGLGEKVDDFISFDAQKFSDALVGIEEV